MRAAVKRQILLSGVLGRVRAFTITRIRLYAPIKKSLFLVEIRVPCRTANFPAPIEAFSGVRRVQIWDVSSFEFKRKRTILACESADEGARVR